MLLYLPSKFGIVAFLRQPVKGKPPPAVLSLSDSENLKICCLDFGVFFDCTFLDNFSLFPYALCL